MIKSGPRRWLVGVGAIAALLCAAQSKARAYPSFYRSDAPPGTLTLDRMDSSERAGVQVGLDRLHLDADDHALAARFELYGQYVVPGHGIGLYGGVALSHVFGNDDA